MEQNIDYIIEQIKSKSRVDHRRRISCFKTEKKTYFKRNLRCHRYTYIQSKRILFYKEEFCFELLFELYVSSSLHLK